jgi:hypothetical protein
MKEETTDSLKAGTVGALATLVRFTPHRSEKKKITICL